MRKFLIYILTTALFLQCSSINISSIKDFTIENLRFNDTSDIDSSDYFKTLISIQKIDDVHIMTYYGDYDSLAGDINHKMIANLSKDSSKVKCSIFSTNRGKALLCRNFDNPDCGVLIGKYNPSKGYSSISFSRLSDFGIPVGEVLSKVPDSIKLRMVYAPFFTPDGINEKGLAVALASVSEKEYEIDSSKQSIFVTCLVRKILDNASNTQDAIKICKKYNVFDSSPNCISHHLMIYDKQGQSAIIEFSDGELKVIKSDKDWQALTNIPVYEAPEPVKLYSCPRYNAIYDYFTENKRELSFELAMSLLKRISYRATQWSAVYNLENLNISFCVKRNYKKVYSIGFD